MKRELRGKKTAYSTIFLKLTANVFEKRVEHCKKCIACQGRYFEKETVTAPPQSFNPEKLSPRNFQTALVCMCVYIYIHIHTYIYTHTHIQVLQVSRKAENFL
jgi:hypothetical protein